MPAERYVGQVPSLNNGDPASDITNEEASTRIHQRNQDELFVLLSRILRGNAEFWLPAKNNYHGYTFFKHEL